MSEGYFNAFYGYIGLSSKKLRWFCWDQDKLWLVLIILIQIWWWDNFRTKYDIRLKLHMLIEIYRVYTKVFSFVKYSSRFWVADVNIIKKSHYFLWKVMQSFRFTVHTYLNYFSRRNCSIIFQEQTTIYYKALKVICYSICYKQVFIRLQQSNLHIRIWVIFDELYTKIGYICDISISVCCSVSRVCFCSRRYK